MAVDWVRPGDRALKHSAFMLTINTNQHDAKYKTPFVNAIEAMARNIQHFIKNTPPWGQAKDPDFFNKVDEKSIVFKPTLEKNEGPEAKNTSWHSHIYIEIKHDTYIQIDVKAVTNFINKALRLPGCNVHVDLISTSSKTRVSRYQHKAPRAAH